MKKGTVKKVKSLEDLWKELDTPDLTPEKWSDVVFEGVAVMSNMSKQDVIDSCVRSMESDMGAQCRNPYFLEGFKSGVMMSKQIVGDAGMNLKQSMDLAVAMATVHKLIEKIRN